MISLIGKYGFPWEFLRVSLARVRGFPSESLGFPQGIPGFLGCNYVILGLATASCLSDYTILPLYSLSTMPEGYGYYL